MNVTNIIAIAITVLVWFHPWMDLQIFRKVIGITLFLDLFYLIGSYLLDWPFPTPVVLIQLFVVTVWGVVLGIVFSRIWPLPPYKGLERVIRTFLVVIPALGLGMGLQLLLQGAQATQAIYLIFALSAWLGSGHFIRGIVEKSNLKKSRLES